MIARLLAKVGLVTPEQRAWAWYDWANSAYFTTVVTAVFPAFYATYAAAGLEPAQATARFGAITTVSVALIAIVSPVLGAIADFTGIRKRLLAVFMLIGVVAAAAMVLIERGDWMLASILFVIGNIGVSGTTVFYDSLLPHVARPEETDRVSSAGYALGYLGGGVLLLLNLAWILQPETFGFADTAAATKASFVSVAVWWLVFSIPLLRHVPEPPLELEPGEARDVIVLTAAFGRLGRTFREMRRYRHAFLLFIAMLLYQDGIQTIIRMASVYGAEIGIDINAQIAAFVMVQFLGIPFSFLFGSARRAHRHQARALHRAGRVYADRDHRLLHDDRDALLHPGRAGGDGAGRQPGAQPRAVLAADSGEEGVGVLRVLCGGRAVRDRARPAGLHGERRVTGSSRIRGAVHHRVLRGRRRAAVDGGRGGGHARRHEEQSPVSWLPVVRDRTSDGCHDLPFASFPWREAARRWTAWTG